GLDAAKTGDKQDTARWVEYLHATKGRNVVTRSQSLDEHYGTPTEQEIDTMLAIQDQTDDQTEEGDDGEDVASIDAAVWNDARDVIIPGVGSLIAAGLTVLEDDGLEALAKLFSRHIEPVETVVHPETRLPHLRYRHRPDTVTVMTGDGETDRIDYDQLGPVARAWYGMVDRGKEVKR
ncbi:MAG: hypothetical protein AAGA65_16585, partial [Actinomycetota bacterium]